MSFKNNYTPKPGETNRTFRGFIVTLEAGYEITDVPILLEVKQRGSSKPVASYSVGNGIERVSALSFKFSPGILNIPAGVYNYDILIQYPQSAVSYISGTWEINETVSRTR